MGAPGAEPRYDSRRRAGDCRQGGRGGVRSVLDERQERQKHMSEILRLIRSDAFWQAFVRGLVPGDLFDVRPPPAPLSPEEALRTDRDALRSDWIRIGADFRSVIEREYGRAS